ncbi:MAG: pyridoxamine 5'-phosphate oxidase family protein [Bacteriovoracaceae bacterium]|nr:pyridoxamine 5'-phosphate oxidase family protein [Bacteriovoracaceae bacterium]
MLANSDKDKLWEMIKPLKYGMLSTYDKDRIRSRPMALTQSEFDGHLYFYTRDDTHKVEEINEKHEVGISFSSPEEKTYVSLSGRAHLSRDRDLIKKFWSPILNAYFQDGVDDPHIALMKIEVEACEFWDSDKGRMSELFELAKSYVRGESPDLGEHGRMQ